MRLVLIVFESLSNNKNKIYVASPFQVATNLLIIIRLCASDILESLFGTNNRI